MSDNRGTVDSRGPPQRGEALVVEPQQRDHLAHVAVALDAACRGAYGIGEEGMTLDATLLAQINPDMAGKAEMRGAITVQVADFAAAQPKPQLAPLAPPCRDARPRSDFCNDRFTARHAALRPRVAPRTCAQHVIVPGGSAGQSATASVRRVSCWSCEVLRDFVSRRAAAAISGSTRCSRARPVRVSVATEQRRSAGSRRRLANPSRTRRSIIRVMSGERLMHRAATSPRA